MIRSRCTVAIDKPASLEDAPFDTPPFVYSEEAIQRILAFLARRRQRDESVTGNDVEAAQLQLVCQFVEGLVRTLDGIRKDNLADLVGGAVSAVLDLSGAKTFKDDLCLIGIEYRNPHHRA